jgi:hypothetical protein
MAQRLPRMSATGADKRAPTKVLVCGLGVSSENFVLVIG